MNDEQNDLGMQQFKAGDLLKRYTVIQVFKTLDDACKTQETISENSYETSFTKRADLVKGLLWKYTPKEIREAIKNLYGEMDNAMKNIDNNLNETNKKLTQEKIAYEYFNEIFKLLLVVLTECPINIEFVEMEVKGDFKELIKTIQNPEPVKLFATEVT